MSEQMTPTLSVILLVIALLLLGLGYAALRKRLPVSRRAHQQQTARPLGATLVRTESTEVIDSPTPQEPDPTQLGRRVVCAANRYSGGILLLGVRHHDALMNAQLRHYRLLGLIGPKAVGEQGFVDNQGTFLSRDEAWEVATASGQILRRVGGNDRGRLFSENYC